MPRRKKCRTEPCHARLFILVCSPRVPILKNNTARANEQLCVGSGTERKSHKRARSMLISCERSLLLNGNFIFSSSDKTQETAAHTSHNKTELNERTKKTNERVRHTAQLASRSTPFLV